VLISGGSPHDKRMARMARVVPRSIKDPLLKAYIEHQAEMDLRFRSEWPELTKQLHALNTVTKRGGSGFRMAKALRDFYQEFTNRLPHGQRAMPSSFNVAEAFLSYSTAPPGFQLREEREHLLRLYEYLNWYTAEQGTLSKDPAVLESLTSEGNIYSYDTLGALEDFKLATPDSTVAILGLSMIRFQHELSLLLVAGENPPFPPNGDWNLEESVIFRGKEWLRPDPSLTTESRIVPGLDGFGQVILLARIDLQFRRFVVRYALLDLGANYLVLTDDPTGLADMEDKAERLHSMKLELRRYDDLFSSMAALIYLPAFFVTRRDGVEDLGFVTELFTDRNSTEIHQAVRLLGAGRVPFSRVVHCLASDVPSSDQIDHVIAAPDLQWCSGGYWKPLPPGEVGQDGCGNSIIGRTWVETHESWSSRGPRSLLLRKGATEINGPDPGFIYIIRSPSHAQDVYKIGLTRRTPSARAKEVGSATGVPLPFGVLAQWEVGDCGSAEARIHQRLAPYRLSRRREFFRAGISIIVAVIESSVALNDGHRSGSREEAAGENAARAIGPTSAERPYPRT
jgi:T5orf172 domain